MVNGQTGLWSLANAWFSRGATGTCTPELCRPYTTHYYQVTCGSQVASGSFQTMNPPLGSNYPELPNFDSNSFGNVAAPTINWTDRDVNYIDPQTGILLKRITGPEDNAPSAWQINNASFTYVLDRTGAWTNPNNALSYGSAGATITQTGAPLFLAWNKISIGGDGGNASWSSFFSSLDDLRIDAKLAGSGTLAACITFDSGQTCASRQLTISGSGAVSVPTDFPHPEFADWGNNIYHDDLVNPAGTANVSGSTVTWVSGDCFYKI